MPAFRVSSCFLTFSSVSASYSSVISTLMSLPTTYFSIEAAVGLNAFLLCLAFSHFKRNVSFLPMKLPS